MNRVNLHRPTRMLVIPAPAARIDASEVELSPEVPAAAPPPSSVLYSPPAPTVWPMSGVSRCVCIHIPTRMCSSAAQGMTYDRVTSTIFRV